MYITNYKILNCLYLTAAVKGLINKSLLIFNFQKITISVNFCRSTQSPRAMLPCNSSTYIGVRVGEAPFADGTEVPPQVVRDLRRAQSASSASTQAPTSHATQLHRS